MTEHTGAGTPLIEARGVSVVFDVGGRRVEAVRNASVGIATAEIVGIVGESGSGKTTFARVLAGLQPMTGGTVLLDGRVVSSKTGIVEYRGDDRRRVQMIFQDPYTSLNPRQRARQAVAEAVHVAERTSRRASRDRAMRLLDSVGISAAQAERRPRELSGGQQQRVSVERALAVRPAVLIADEPTSSIDQSAQAQLLNLLRDLRDEWRLAIMFISHDLALIRYLTDRTLVMRSGDVVESGGTAQLFDQPAHEYTKVLIRASPSSSRIADEAPPLG